ncbi:hypothetical protein JVT61DRAFT_15487 [Boletus reticuloceps]|uniref:Uncharacterized protein n=1 Tax=Boletus reticuloceps TaxID=495285 RepID=A0A8I3A3S9_9AGAM|nr:hypothetical protein JVT61DRAFT_15487 [Boletus reticuloceps]
MALCRWWGGRPTFFCSSIHTKRWTAILCSKSGPSHILAICFKSPSDHLQCKTHKWFRWADGLGRSPKTSPTVTQSATLPGPQLQAEPSISEQATTGTSKVTCAHSSCQIIHVAQFCQRRMCRKHCRSHGGCTHEGHSPSAETLLSLLVPTPPLLVPSSHRSHPIPATQNNNSSLDAITESSTPLFPDHQRSPSLSQIDPSLLLDSGLPSLPSSSLSGAPTLPPLPPAPSPLLPTSLPSATLMVTSDRSGNEARYKSHLRSYAAEHVAATLKRTELKRKNDAELA